MALQKNDTVQVESPDGIPRDMIVRELWTNAKPYWEFESTKTGDTYVVSFPVIMRKVA